MTNDSLLIFEQYNKLVTEAKRGSMTAPDYYGTQPKGTIHAFGMGRPGAESTKVTTTPIEKPEKLIALKNYVFNNRLKNDFETGHYIPLEGANSPLEAESQEAIKKMTSDGTLSYLNEYKNENVSIIPYWNIPETVNKLIDFLKIFKQEKNKNNVYATKELLQFLLSSLLSKPFWESVYRNSKPYLDATTGKSYQVSPKDEYDKYAPKLKEALNGLNSKKIIVPSYDKPFFIVPNVYEAKRLNSDGTWESVSHLRAQTKDEDLRQYINLFHKTTGGKFQEPAIPPQETPTSSQQGKENPATSEEVLRAQISERRKQMLKLVAKHGKDSPEVKQIQKQLMKLQERLPANKKLTVESFFKIIPF